MRAANNVFDGEPVPLVTITQPWTMQIPRYPVGQRAVFEELVACAGQPTCTYQASAAGAVVVQATLTETRVLAARNTGATGAHVKITADSTTLTYGDTTVFRVTVPGAPDSSWTVTGYQFASLGLQQTAALLAVRGYSERSTRTGQRIVAFGAPVIGPTNDRTARESDVESVSQARKQRPVHFRDAEHECDGATSTRCFDDPQDTGYEIVTALVDGISQRDSVLVTVLRPPALVVRCTPATVVRGDSVICTIGLSDSTLQFAVDSLAAQAAADMSVLEIGLQAPGQLPAGRLDTLQGVAVTNTSLTALATLTWNGRRLSLRASARFEVAKRPRELQPYIMTLSAHFMGPGRTTAYPSYATGGGTLGLYESGTPRFDLITVSTVQSGPNSGLTYVRTMPGVPESKVWITDALTSGSRWYDAHPIVRGPLDPSGTPLCTRDKIDLLRMEVGRHEGLTSATKSHYGVQQAFMTQWNLAKVMGARVIQVPADSAHARMSEEFRMEWLRFWKQLDVLQSKFDSVDTPASFARLGGCSIYPE
ncbi:MAG: hypothetical protein HYV19_10455 [Gemmatimonadetes bacterium]|nr:hypothetical protein [Gemmatimonadota bacterium]